MSDYLKASDKLKDATANFLRTIGFQHKDRLEILMTMAMQEGAMNALDVNKEARELLEEIKKAL